ncbi:hypothetical protein K435DRAFT_834829 [Dendrothele bispora CBS 962.96]|uniref:L domain-like protein n=1 Tax=Dendrothele bispora (strain CBS 962.96) TaxID=1314807 RepID=A0A4S8MQX9_DENBC|nr:hypothetical protein K435DRAFT_834829 [Dendrothele bispora CBS 962.96]
MPPYRSTSSPPSSPSVYVDSSPPSSPIPDFALDSEWSQTAGDPFAGSFKAGKLPLYEKKRPISPILDSSIPKKTRFDRPPSPQFSDDVEEILLPAQQSLTVTYEESVCDSVLRDAFDNSHLNIDLESRQLSYLPQEFLRDLNLLYVPSEKDERAHTSSSQAFQRTLTEPALPFGRSGTFNRTRSVTCNSGFPRHEVQLFLASNKISSLPHQLFDLNKLTFLSLRDNKLTFIPPEIVRLKNLQVLNISRNQITFLPAEMKNMTLRNLFISPNPFLEPPATTNSFKRKFSRSSTSRKRLFSTPVISSTISLLPKVVPLFEVCCRRLLSPLEVSPNEEEEKEEEEEEEEEEGEPALGTRSLLSDYYAIPLDGEALPPSVLHCIKACQPSCVRDNRGLQDLSDGKVHSSIPFEQYLRDRSQSMPYESMYPEVTRPSVCPSPRHVTGPSVFIMHSEERFTWENTVAGVTDLGQIPLRWRGCQAGCLDFLDCNGDENLRPSVNPVSSQHDHVPDNESGDVVRVLDVSTAPLEFDDFD